MALRVAFRISRPAEWIGGVNYIINMCRVLRLYTDDIQPVVFAPGDINDNLRHQIASASGRDPIEMQNRSRFSDIFAILGWQELGFQRSLRAAEIDVFFEGSGYYGARPAVPTVGWLPDFQHRTLPHQFTRVQWLIRELRFRLVIRNRGSILLSSRDAETDAARFYKVSAGDRFSVVPFAVHVENPPTWETCERVRLKYGLPERFVFLPNQFWKHKNHGLVIDALISLGEAAPVIVSTGNPFDKRDPSYASEMLAKLEAHGLTDKFIVLGLVPYSDILALNARSVALINPSLCEGWSTTVEEAKALGTPLILSDLAVHYEQAGELATFFDRTSPIDCARALLSVNEARAPGGYADEQACATYAHRMAAIFRSVYARSRGRARREPT